mmetsp:Transcript_56152/g.97433  ORF Transcript_56152/g.97433 Transcript_56152/m.97433 type:complete len:211 (+) Transcript_56152:1-633(+)
MASAQAFASPGGSAREQRPIMGMIKAALLPLFFCVVLVLAVAENEAGSETPASKKEVKVSEEALMVVSVMEHMDTNKDSKISMQELLDHAGDDQELVTSWGAGFNEADSDKDGLLNIDEFGFLLKQVEKDEEIASDEAITSALENFDEDKDGKLSMEELEKILDSGTPLPGWRNGFKEADADNDGHLNSEELAYLFKLFEQEGDARGEDL